MVSKSIVFTGPFEVEVKDIEVPAPQAGELLVKTFYTGVSTGTETRVLSGKQGGCDFPLVPGYENIGEVIEVGEGVSLKPGDVVFNGGSNFTGDYCKCWGAQQAYSIINENSAFVVPSGLDPIDGVYGHVGAIALRGIKRAKVTSGDTVAIVGLGLIGHLAAQSAKAFGATVIGIDTDPQRLEYAKQAGIDYQVNAKEEDVREKVREYSNGGVSVAVDVTGIAATIKGTANLVYDMPWAEPYPAAPRILILGSYTDPIELDYDPLFMNEVDIHFSRDMRSEDLVDILNLIHEGKVKPSVLPAKCYDVSDAHAAYKELVDQKMMRILFKWS